MKKKEMKTKVMAVAMSATMAASICPAVPAMAVTKDQVAKDGTYTKTAHVARTQEDDEYENEWNEYDVQVALTVKDGKFSDIVVTHDDNYNSENDSYFDKAYKKSKGIQKQLVGKQATEDTINSWDTVSGATRSSKAIKEAALAAIQSAPEASTAATVNTAALEEVINKAKTLNESDYTSDTWKTLQEKLTAAQTALSEKKSQDAVDTAKKELETAIEALVKSPTEEYKYVYAGLSWAEYWAAEGVQAAGDSSSSDETDKKGELDKGAFDVVTRATTNHGLHRGSYQCMAIIEAENGKSYEVSYWTDKNTAVLTDGKTITFDRGAITEEDGTTTQMTEYDVTGLKYVPVKVASEDYEAFCKAYKVVENGGELAGGFTENNLNAYTGLKAEVTAETNGLKTATKNADGTFSFSAKEAGTGSGIEGQKLKTAPSAEEAGLTVQEANGSYGEFLRVDLKGNYGDLGANMQSVKWTYYGDDSTYTNAKATYGTKFAADNWMHKVNGIQLGLTKSLRCTLPEGTDGTGYWTITISALGYKDVTYNFQATDANIVKEEEEEISTTDLETAIAKAEGLTESDYTADSWAAMQTELQEAKDELKAPHTQATVDEATSHLNAAIAALVKAETKETYVLMNIPYAAFYKSETTNNDVDVDVFTSATKNKTRTTSLSGGSYHENADGSQIDGITFAVKVDSSVDLTKYKEVKDTDKVDITVTNRGQTSTTTLEGKDTLFENETYAYYPLTETPANYKEVSMDKDGNLVFSEVKGQEAEALTGVTAELLTQSSYGDYQLNLEGLPEDKITSSNVNAVVVKTTDGTAYGMRHLENIWRGNELAWSTGYTESVHGCPTSSAHYASMMGKTIDSIEYYTTNGLYTIDIDDLYVPVKFAKDEDAVKVADSDIATGKATVDLKLQDDFEPQYSVEGLDATVEGNVLTYKAASAKPGKYTLTVTDKKGKYADIVTSFLVTTEDMPAVYDTENKKLVAAEGFDADALASYIGNITSVNVNGTDYAASGRGFVKIINQDGTLVTDAAPFKNAAAGTEFTITVTATGYTTPLTFAYKVAGEDPAPVEVDTTKIAESIATAEGLKESDYTADSWGAFQTALANAKAAMEAKESQEAVNAAADALSQAMNALAKAGTEDPVKKVTTDALEKAIATAGALKEADYTADSWKALQTALANAKTALEEKKEQSTVDAATDALNKAISALVKKDSESPKASETSNPSGKSGNTGSGLDSKNGKAAKTGDPSGMFAWLGLAVTSLGAGIGGFKLKRKKKDEEEM